MHAPVFILGNKGTFKESLVFGPFMDLISKPASPDSSFIGNAAQALVVAT